MKKQTLLESQIKKIELPGLDADYYYERVSSYPENEWFCPTNGNEHQDFQICYELSAWNLIEKRNEPIWASAGFRGQRIFFRYKKDLKYSSN